VSEPEGSANWFPLNDHPTDKAAFTFVVTMPAGLEAISNGRLVGNKTHGRWTTCVWNALDLCGPYLATATIGQFVLRTYRTPDGLRMYDAVDSDLYDLPVDPRTPPRRPTARSRTGRSRARPR
jgi:aminopeptidase N